MASRRSALKLAAIGVLLASPSLAALTDLNYLSSDTDVFSYSPSGSWSASSGLMYSNNSEAVITFKIDATVASFTFNGATKYDRGFFDVIVDGVNSGTCDAYSPAGASVTTGAICTTTLDSTGSEHVVQYVNYPYDSRVGYAPYLTLGSVDVYAVVPSSSPTTPTITPTPSTISPTSSRTSTPTTSTTLSPTMTSSSIVAQSSSFSRGGGGSAANTMVSSTHSVTSPSSSSTPLFPDVTQTSSPTPSPAAKHSNVAAIAGGVAGGVGVLLAAILGMCCMRRRQKQAEEEHFLGGSAYRDSAHTEYTDSPPMQQMPYQAPHPQVPNRFSTFSGHAEFPPVEEHMAYETK